MSRSRLRLAASEVQGRLLPLASMPRRPLERGLVDAIRSTLTAMGLVNWSGRLHIHGRKPGHSPYVPILGPGTPDVLFVTRKGKLAGIEAKRDDASKERSTQERWRTIAAATGVRVAVVRDVREAAAFVVEVSGGET